MALAADDLTIEKWAESHTVSYTHLLLVLKRRRVSRALDLKIDSYIAETLVPFCRAFLAKVEVPSVAA